MTLLALHAASVDSLLLSAASSQISTADLFTYIGIGAGLIGAAAGGFYWMNRAAHQRRYDSHPGLFDALCRAHELGRSDRALLSQLAGHYQLTQPGRLFVDPSLFDPTRLGQPLKAKAKDLLALRDALFVEPEEAPQPADKPGQSPKPKTTSPVV